MEAENTMQETRGEGGLLTAALTLAAIAAIYPAYLLRCVVSGGGVLGGESRFAAMVLHKFVSVSLALALAFVAAAGWDRLWAAVEAYIVPSGAAAGFAIALGGGIGSIPAAYLAVALFSAMVFYALLFAAAVAASRALGGGVARWLPGSVAAGFSAWVVGLLVSWLLYRPEPGVSPWSLCMPPLGVVAGHSAAVAVYVSVLRVFLRRTGRGPGG